MLTNFFLHTISQHLWTIRLRAAVFINACAIRDAVTLRQGPILTPSNMQKLETANYLFHSALNCALILNICIAWLISNGLTYVRSVCAKGWHRKLYRRRNCSGKSDQNYISCLVCIQCASIKYDMNKCMHAAEVGSYRLWWSTANFTTVGQLLCWRGFRGSVFGTSSNCEVMLFSELHITHLR